MMCLNTLQQSACSDNKQFIPTTDREKRDFDLVKDAIEHIQFLVANSLVDSGILADIVTVTRSAVFCYIFHILCKLRFCKSFTENRQIRFIARITIQDKHMELSVYTCLL